MATPLYNTDIIPLTSRPTLTVMDDGDYFVILDTSTGKISKILKTLAMEALKISYDNSTSGLTAENVQSALDELVADLGSVDDAIKAIKGAGWNGENLVDHEERIAEAEGDIVNLEAKDVLLDERIDNIIEGQDIDPNKDVEVLDARYSPVTGTTYANIGDRMEEGETRLATIEGEIREGVSLTETDIGIVSLPSNAQGNANPTVEGLTATNPINNSNFALDSNSDGLADNFSVGTTITSYSFMSGAQTVSLRTLGVGHQYHSKFDTPIFTDAEIDLTGTWLFIIHAKNNEATNATLEIGRGYYLIKSELFTAGETKSVIFVGTMPNAGVSTNRTKITFGASVYDQSFTFYSVIPINLTSIFGAGNEPSEADCAKIFSYFDGTKSISMPARVRSVGRNLLPPNYFIDGYRLQADGIVSYGSVGYSASPVFIPVSPNSHYTINWADVNRICCFYDKNRNFIGYGSPTDFWYATGQTPPNCFFIRFGFSKQAVYQSNLYLVKTETQTHIMPCPYEPYTDSTLYIADNEEVRSIQDVQDTLTIVNGEYIYTKKVSTPASVASGVAVNVTNYPTAKTGGKFAVELTAGGTQIGVIGTDSTSGAGTLRFELDTPVITNLLTSGTLKAFQNGSVYYEPYYEGSHQTDASSEITLPYEGTIEAVYGYDEDLVEYLLDSSEYSLAGTTLTITGALEN